MALESEKMNGEQEKKDESIESFFSVLKEAREKEEGNEEKEIPKILEELPKDLRSLVSEDFQRFKSYGLTESQLLAELKHDVEVIKFAYEDKRFEIQNGSYLRYELKHLIDDLVVNSADRDESLKKTRGFGVISLDVNGLKAVNDIVGHEAGTEYLKRIAETLKAGETTKELETAGVKVSVSSNGGDEFVIILSDHVNLTEIIGGKSRIDGFLRKYQAEIGALNVSDLFDFSRPEIIAKFTDVKIPAGFKFIASVSGGTAHIEEVLIIEGFKLDAEKGYSDNLMMIITDIFQLSDRRCKEDKIRFKAELEESGDPQKNFLGLLFKRNLEVSAK